MNGWVFPCGEDLSENRRIRPRAPAYEAHLQGDARASQRLPAPSHSLSGTLQIEARTQRGSVCMAPRFLGGSALCSAPPKRLFRASPCTLILRTPNCLRSLSGHSSGFEDVSSDSRPESVRLCSKIALVSLAKVSFLLVPAPASN